MSNKKNVTQLTPNKDMPLSPIKRFFKHLLLDKSSFESVSLRYMGIMTLVMLITLIGVRLCIFFVLLSKITFTPPISDLLTKFIESTVMGTILSTLVQFIVWGTLLYAIIKLLGGKGRYVQTLFLFGTGYAVIPIITLLLLIIAAFQPHIVVSTTGQNFAVDQAFMVFQAFNIINMVVILLAYLYAHVIASVGLSVEHRLPHLLTLLLSLIVYVIVMMAFWLI